MIEVAQEQEVEETNLEEQDDDENTHSGFDDFLKDMLRHQNDEEDKSEDV